MKVKARATRVGQWWAIEADVAGGLHTQARRLEQAPVVVADAVSLVVGMPKEQIVVELDVVLSGEDRELLDRARALSIQASRAAEDASAARLAAVRALRERGLTVRDTGELLGVSPQRVSQLLEV